MASRKEPQLVNLPYPWTAIGLWVVILTLLWFFPVPLLLLYSCWSWVMAVKWAVEYSRVNRFKNGLHATFWVATAPVWCLLLIVYLTFPK